MKRLIAASAISLFIAVPAMAQAPAAPVKAQDLFYASAQHGEWRASKLIGVKVTNAAGETIGDINNLLIDKERKVATVIIGVGGYLGMGERHAAVTFNALQLTRDPNDKALASVNLTKEQLAVLPEWIWQPGNDWRTRKLMGAKVVNMGGDTIGDINELLINKEGDVAAAIIGVGGYLGIGERHTAISFSSLQPEPDSIDHPLVRLRITKEQLLAAPEWKWQPAKSN